MCHSGKDDRQARYGFPGNSKSSGANWAWVGEDAF